MFYCGVSRKIDFDSEDDSEVTDVDGQYNVQDDSDTRLVSAEGNDESDCDEEESDIESVTKDEDNDADFSSV